MAGSTSPVIRARNAKYQAGRRAPGRSSSSSSSYADRKATKTPTNPYVVAILVIMLSGGAIFQILKLFGLDTEPQDNF
ncbi:hypothetical protein EC968_004577 [Mortierella alpina]|nr:hypothetical protein EC968_004577 [Mortierella alpina]